LNDNQTMNRIDSISAPGDVLPIADYGAIGDGHTVALVGRNGSIDWLCLPRFDSPSVFARILDVEQGGFWQICPIAAFESTHQYVDATNVLKTTFTCETGQALLLDFMAIGDREQMKQPDQPSQLIRMIEGLQGSVEILCVCVPRPDYAQTLPQFVSSGDQSNTRVDFDDFSVTAPVHWQIDSITHTLTCRLTIQVGDRVAFALSSNDSTQPIYPRTALETTIAYWQGWANQCTYQGRYREEVVRSALALKLMIYAPTGAIVAAPTTSLPEVVGGDRNWDYRFSWIRDSSFTLYALLMAGYFDSERPFFDWLARTVKVESMGIKILYPITPDGQVAEQTLDHLQGYRNSRPVRIGNDAVEQLQVDVYGEVLSALHFAWKAGKFNPASIWSQIRPMVDWAADHWHEPDHGIWETRDGTRHFVYGKVMLWVALDCGIEIADSLDLPGDSGRWRQERDRIRAEVLQKGWSHKLNAFKQSYEDETLDAANLLLPIAGFIEGTDPRMIATIDATIQHLVVDGLCYRYRAVLGGTAVDETFSEASFVLCTFWLINALILAGRADEAAAWFERMLARSTSLGLFAEEIDPKNGLHLGNFPQAFSHLGVINVAVSLAHLGHTGSIDPQHRAAADAAGRGGCGAKETIENSKAVPAGDLGRR
jgi:GH15 family glucan-1,4-alpha-glucosidase